MADETLQQQPPTFSDELYKYAHDSGFIPKEATFDIFKKNLSNKDFVKELYDYSVQTEFIPKEATIDIFIKNIGGTNPAEKKNEKPATVSPVGGGSSGLLSVKFGGEDYEVNPTTQQVFKGGKPVTVPAHIKDYIEKNIIGSKPKDKPAEKPYVAKGAVILPEDYFDKKAMPKETAWLISDLTGMDMTALQNSPQVVDEAFKDLSTYTGIAVDKTSNPETITKAIGQAKMLRDTKEFTKLAKDAGVTEKKALEIAYDNAADKFLDSGDKELWALTKQVNQAFEGGDKATVDKLMPVWEKARKQFIDNRHDKITSLHNMIITGKNVDGVPLTSAAIEDLKKEKNLLTKQLNGFFKSPEAVVKDVVGSTPMLSVFDKQLEGKTGQQKLETIAKPMLARYFLLGKKMGVKTEDIMGEGNARKMQTDKTYLDDVKNYMGWGDYDGEVTSSDRKEFNDLHNKLGIIMPMLLINKIPVQDVEDKPVDILKKGALSMTPALATMNQTGQQKTNTLNDILALANITPDDLTQDALTSINTNMKKYGWAQDLAQMGGSTLSIIAPMMLAEAGAGFAIESLALNPRTAMAANFLLKNPVGKVIKGGTTFSAAGKISDGEELDFGTGAASGVVDVVLDALGSKNKAMAKWFISTFGKQATKYAAIAAKPLAKGTGEFFQESGETVYQAWRDTPEGKSVMETLQKQFPDADSRLKFFVGTTIMGGGMGLAGDIGFGGAKKRAYDALSPENKAKADAFMATRNQKAKDAVDEVVPVASNDAIENNLKVAKEAKEKLEKLANRDVEAEDKVIADFQQRTGYEPTLVEDVPKSIDTTLSRIDNGLPVDQTAKDELADWAYEQYKKLSLLKKSDARKATTAQIQQAQDYLEGIITNINDEITAKKIEAEKDTEGITPYSIEVDGVTYSGSTLQDLQRDIDFLDHVENTANDELYKRNTGQTETPPIAEADQTDVELAKPEAGVGVEGEVVPETVQNAQESGQNDTNVTFEGKRGQADSISFDGKTIKQGEEIELNDVNISQDDSMPDLRSGKYKVRMLSVDANGKTATLTLTDGNEVITTTVKDLRKALTTPTTTTQTATEPKAQEGLSDIYYHGSPTPNIAELKLNKTGLLFFTKDKNIAERYATNDFTGNTSSTNVYTRKLNIKNIFDPEKQSDNSDIIELLANTGNFENAGRFADYNELAKQALEDGEWSVLETKEFIDGLKKMGYDAIYIDNRPYYSENKDGIRSYNRDIAVFDEKAATEILPQEGEVKETVSDTQVSEPLKDVNSTAEAIKKLKVSDLPQDLVDTYVKGNSDGHVRIAEAYHKAKADKSNPDLVKAVEELLAPKGEVKAEPSNTIETETKDGTKVEEIKPSKVVGFNEGVEAVKKNAEEYKKILNEKRKQQNPSAKPQRANEPVPKLFTAVSKMIADAYNSIASAPSNEEVKAAYDALIEETAAQYNFIVSKGLKVERHTGKGEPYVNSKEMLRDIKENNTLKFLPNDVAFGQGTTDVSDNIGLRPSGIKLKDGYELTNSEVFRIVHDYFGHGILGNEFGAIGEENATLQHLDLYSDLAAPAVIFQTRGQNSWVNFSGVNDKANELRKKARELKKQGKLNEAKKLLEEADKIFKFAEPKIAIFPTKFNFKRYETARRIAEKKQVDSRPNKRADGLSKLLERLSEKSGRATRGVNKRSIRGVKRLGGFSVNVKAEYTLDSKINQAIAKAFPDFKGVQKIYEVTDGKVFREMMLAALKTNKFASSVTVHSAEEFDGMRMFVTEDGSTGITLTKEGFIGGGFSDPSVKRPNNLAPLLVLGIKEGATTAEAFDTILPDYYAQFGFKAVSRVDFNDELKPDGWDYNTYKKYNNGKPDVVLFIFDGGDRNTIEDRVGLFDDYENYEKENTKQFDKDSYGEAVDFMKQAAVKRLEFDLGIEPSTETPPTEKVEAEPTADIDNVADKAGIAPKKAKKAAIQSDVIDKLVGNAANRREAYKEITDENIKEVAKIITDTNGKFDKVMDAIDNNDQLLADLEKKLGIKKICRI